MLAAIFFAGAAGVSGQLTYARGQNVVAAFEGWERTADGTYNLVFSYYNRNYEEGLDVPVGPDNSVEPGGPDQGQPTYFAPGRHRYVFSVKVPKDWNRTKRLVWTLTVRGRTEKANAFLLPEWEINNQVRAMNTDANPAGTGGEGAEQNQAPQITVDRTQTISLPAQATLTALVTDDGLPKPRARRPTASRASAATPERGASGPAADGASPTITPARGPQLRVEWVKYRGPVGGRIQFTPDTSPVVEGKATTTASFTVPGQYVVRAYANDGAVTTPADVAFTVLPSR